MLNVMASLPNIGGALCPTPQSLADAPTRLPCSNAAKTRNPLKFAGVPQTPEPITARVRTIVTIGLSLQPIVALSDDYRSR